MLMLLLAFNIKMVFYIFPAITVEHKLTKKFKYTVNS